MASGPALDRGARPPGLAGRVPRPRRPSRGSLRAARPDRLGGPGGTRRTGPVWSPVRGGWRPRVAVLKRALDVVAALVGLLLLLPVLLGLALVVRLSSPGPALFRQERVGRDGVPFVIWKFRTMRPGAERQLDGLLRENGRDCTPLFKVAEDPRVTPVGRLLRRTSLDELPQLVNVLRGDMSLVGPRPQCAAEVALYEPEHRRRLDVRPGMTGLWQVSGRSALTWEECVTYDLRYVDEWSLWLDLRILARTVGAVVRGSGAQ